MTTTIDAKIQELLNEYGDVVGTSQSSLTKANMIKLQNFAHMLDEELKPLIEAEKNKAVLEALTTIRQEATDQLASLKERAIKTLHSAEEYRGIAHGRNSLYVVVGTIDEKIVDLTRNSKEGSN